MIDPCIDVRRLECKVRYLCPALPRVEELFDARAQPELQPSFAI